MADGDLIAPQDTFVWNAVATYRPRAVHVYGDVYAFCYEQHPARGRLATIDIDSLGNIGASLLGNLQFEAANCKTPDIIHISGNVFAIAYTGVDTDGFLKTFTINNDGSIDGTPLDTFEFETTHCLQPKIIHIADTTYCICYATASTGELATITISDAGAITDPVLATKTFEANATHWQKLVKVADNMFAIFYNRVGFPSYVKTWGISDAGVFDVAQTDNLDLGGLAVSECNACFVSGNIYAFTMIDMDTKGYLKTVDILPAGSVGSIKDTFIFDDDVGSSVSQHVLRLSDYIICISYAGSGTDGFMKTIEISSVGSITDPVLDSLEFDTDRGAHPFLLTISGNIYAVFYQGPDTYGTIKSPGIETPTQPAAQHLLLMGIG
ncbi:hypothetical protein ES702_05654 [subsurface metagenome]